MTPTRAKKLLSGKHELKSLEELAWVARERKSVVCPESIGPFAHRTPAAFIMSMQAHYVLRYLRLGLYVYVAKAKKTDCGLVKAARYQVLRPSNLAGPREVSF